MKMSNERAPIEVKNELDTVEDALDVNRDRINELLLDGPEQGTVSKMLTDLWNNPQLNNNEVAFAIWKFGGFCEFVKGDKPQKLLKKLLEKL